MNSEHNDPQAMTPEQRAAEVAQLRREHPRWVIWFARPAPELAGSYYARPRHHEGPATVTARTAAGLRNCIAAREGP